MNLFRRAYNLLPFVNSSIASCPDATSAERGAYGEALAADYCKRRLGYKLITRNWHGSYGELDLICGDKDTLVFIEVRARAEKALVTGYHSIDTNKKAVLHRTCRQYLNQIQHPPKHFRFDIIDVVLSCNKADKVRHYKNIPLFHKHYKARNFERQ